MSTMMQTIIVTRDEFTKDVLLVQDFEYKIVYF